MHLSQAELHWLPWFGKHGKLSLRWSCFLNQHRYRTAEKVFSGIANTRQKLLLNWADNQWESLENLALLLHNDASAMTPEFLQEKKKQNQHFSELFIVDKTGKVLISTYSPRVGKSDLPADALAIGLKSVFVHGPYVDPMTETIGPSSSKFHDAVTLMFYRPIQVDGMQEMCLCGRIPNDVMSDLIQREQGHIFRESGDNYVFMVESNFDPRIAPGTALSRSRFEDNTFTHGDNLKTGVNTQFGAVRVKQHTELELCFNDPASEKLHPGVRETIANGENLFVTYPGYPDYRHIPVIGKGVTLQFPNSPDRWGMMCEGDLEEVYRQRSLGYCLMRLFILLTGFLWLARTALVALLPASVSDSPVITFGLLLLGWICFYFAGVRPISRRLTSQSELFLNIAECNGSLKLRLNNEDLKNDEAGELGGWINSFIDKVDDTVKQVADVADMLEQASSSMSKSSATVVESATAQSVTAAATAAAVEQMLVSTARVEEQANETRTISKSGTELSSLGKETAQKASEEMTAIAQALLQSSQIILTLEQSSNEITQVVKVIRDIADQTNLLALNAAIEAARAGEHGRGFAVVADEVRSLASRTSQSTNEINQTISSIRSETQNAVNTMRLCSEQAQRGMSLANEAAKAMDQINAGAEQTLKQVLDIAAATRGQSEASNNIALNVAKIAHMAEGNNHVALDSRVAAKNLEQLADNLLKAVNRFTT
jgi:methyl-accepting chemotaxis protein